MSDPLSQVLFSIVKEGHAEVTVKRWPFWPWEDVWVCGSDRATTKWEGGPTEEYVEWEFANHHGYVRGATPMEAAQKRLDQIRLGKSLTWLAFAAPEAP